MPRLSSSPAAAPFNATHEKQLDRIITLLEMLVGQNAQPQASVTEADALSRELDAAELQGWDLADYLQNKAAKIKTATKFIDACCVKSPGLQNKAAKIKTATRGKSA